VLAGACWWSGTVLPTRWMRWMAVAPALSCRASPWTFAPAFWSLAARGLAVTWQLVGTILPRGMVWYYLTTAWYHEVYEVMWCSWVLWNHAMLPTDRACRAVPPANQRPGRTLGACLVGHGPTQPVLIHGAPPPVTCHLPACHLLDPSRCVPRCHTATHRSASNGSTQPPPIIATLCM